MAIGQRTIFEYIELCRELGCSHIQPWAAHFHTGVPLEQITAVGYDPAASGCPPWYEPPEDSGFISDVASAVRAAGMEAELIAVDRASVFWPEPVEAAERRTRAKRWLDVAARLGAIGIRVDSGGPEIPDHDTYAAICDGYRDLVREATKLGLEVYIENHWGSSSVPENIVAFLEEVEGLHYLFDTNNWQPGRQRDGWRLCAPLAQSTHIKSLGFTETGTPLPPDLPDVVQQLFGSGYTGMWGVESFPDQQDEVETVKATLDMIERSAASVSD